MTPSTTTTVGAREIQVSGLTTFSWERWAEAIKYYLDGLKDNNRDVIYRPKINFGPFTLRLLNGGIYTASANAGVGGDERVRMPDARVTMLKDSDRQMVNFCLWRLYYVKMPMIVSIPIKGGGVHLWKDTDEVLKVAAVDLPPADES